MYENIEDRNALYADAIKAWGWEAQVDMAVEELAEAIVAIQKLFKRDYSARRLHDLAGEVADVHIMMEEVKYILASNPLPPDYAGTKSFEELVQEQIEFKLVRTRQRIDTKHQIQNREGQQ